MFVRERTVQRIVLRITVAERKRRSVPVEKFPIAYESGRSSLRNLLVSVKKLVSVDVRFAWGLKGKLQDSMASQFIYDIQPTAYRPELKRRNRFGGPTSKSGTSRN